MHNVIRISISNMTEYCSVIAGLTRESLSFKSYIEGDQWVIIITGY